MCMLGYIISCIILVLILLAFLPAMIAAEKGYPFSRWYVYGLLLFPFALFNSIRLKKPVTVINIHSTEANGSRKRKCYKRFLAEKSRKKFHVKYLCAVFFTKLISSISVSLMAFALMRLYMSHTVTLCIICGIFTVLGAVLLSITEVCGFSRIPMLADEVTKRMLMIFTMSIIISVPMTLLHNVIISNIPAHKHFASFACTLASSALFAFVIFKSQQYYYSVFYKFFDYCVLSLFSYAGFAAATLIMLSVSLKVRAIAYVIAMPMQLLNFVYFNDVAYIGNLSSIYSAAIVHGILMLLMLVSGLGCKNFKRKELLERVEYRTKAFRISHKRVLRRHLPKMNTTVRPLV